MLTEIIQTLATELAKKDTTTSYLAKSLGQTTALKEEQPWLVIQPSEKELGVVTIVNLPGTDTPAYISIALPGNSKLTSKQLEKTFGAFSVLPLSDWNRPREIIFLAPVAETAYTFCKLIAEIDRDEQKTLIERISIIIIRREFK